MALAPTEIAARGAGERPHQIGGVAAGELEKHQIGRRIVEKRRQRAA